MERQQRDGRSCSGDAGRPGPGGPAAGTVSGVVAEVSNA